MIKKSIASILIILIFINSIGCVSYKPIGIVDKNEIEEAREIRLTTVDNKEYILTNVLVEDSVLSGNQWVQNKIMERRIEFSAAQILYIEVEEFHTGSTIWLIIGISILTYVSWYLNTHPFWGA